MNFVIVLGIVIAFSLILMAWQSRKKAAHWQGAVTSIRKQTVNRGQRQIIKTYQYVIKYRTDAGKRGKIRLGAIAFAKLFSDLREGDRLVKVAGEYLPKKA